MYMFYFMYCITFYYYKSKVFLDYKVTKLTAFVHAGIEDAFKTAATEVSLLAGTEDFNATELFGVGKQFRPAVPLLDVFT